MDTRTASITGNWNDPDLPEKAKAFFLNLLREKREERLSRPAPTEEEGGAQTHLGLDNLPETCLPPDSFRKLLRIRQAIRDVTDRPFVETDDARTAAHDLMRRAILCEADRFISALLFYLAFDRRFHPGRNFDARAAGLLGFGSDEAGQTDHYNRMHDLFVCMALCNVAWPPARPNPAFDAPLAVLHDCGEIFFGVLHSVFPLCETGQCHMSFLTFCENLGVHTDEQIVARYVQCRNAMQLAIETCEAREETPAPSMTALGQRIDKLVRIVANMDRRQKALLDYVKKTIAAFVKLFRPRAGIPAPAREAVSARLMPPDRYKCLAKVREPHRSQLKTVIDYTETHPIVHKQKKQDDFSLARAARAVWEQEHATWEKVPGTFATFEDLKSACYHLQQGKDDPFTYRK